MIEIYFHTPSFIPVDNITDAVIILRNTDSLCEKCSFIPAFMIIACHISKRKRITKRRLIDTHITIGIPFFIISPGEVKFMFPYFLPYS